MKARSGVEPNWYFLKEIEQKDDGIAFVLRVRWNIHQVTVEDMDKQTRTEYEYDERILKHKPSQPIAQDEITAYINECKAELLTEAQGSAELQTLTELDIDDIRKQPVKTDFVKPKTKIEAAISSNTDKIEKLEKAKGI